MSTTTTTRYYKITTAEPIRTNLTIGNRQVWLTANEDGLVRQIKGDVADPRIDEVVANALRGDRLWRVSPWPEDYEPEEQIIPVRAGEFHSADPDVTGEDFAREAMYSSFKFIGKDRPRRRLHPDAEENNGVDPLNGGREFERPLQPEANKDQPQDDEFDDDLDLNERPGRSRRPYRPADAPDPGAMQALSDQVSSLMAEVTAQQGMIATLERTVEEVNATNARLAKDLDSALRPAVPTVPPKDAPGRAAPTAEDLGKGPNLNKKRTGGRRVAAATDDDVAPVGDALAGMRQG